MNKDDIYLAWAPLDSAWSAWVKPVLFSQMDNLPLAAEPVLPAAPDLPPIDRDAAVVVDLPADQGVVAGLQLAAMGFRPTPLYNACPAPAQAPATVNVAPIISALASAAPLLQQLSLPSDAPPAFLLDANRRTSSIPATPGTFDNRSISLPTDFPSANLLLSRNLRRVVLIQPPGATVQADLSHTLLRWQQAGLPIYTAGNPPQLIEIQKPSGFRVIFYNTLALLGLKRNPLGGFGGLLPMGSVG